MKRSQALENLLVHCRRMQSTAPIDDDFPEVIHDWHRALQIVDDSEPDVGPGLTFNQLRAANRARLPQFKNSKGGPAHSEPDGSDWSPAQWLQVLVGEVGEYANLRKKFERGDIEYEEFMLEAADELADIQTYLDLLAMRLGLDLGGCTRFKFNKVSNRVGSDVKL